MANEKRNSEIDDYNLRIGYSHYLHEAGIHDKSFINNKKLAILASEIGDLDIAEHCYLRAIDDADKMNHLEDKVESMSELVDNVYLRWVDTKMQKEFTKRRWQRTCTH
ncbi:MAG: hypothetical protein M3Y53_05355 [Thermoproteota archaeon]|nr:hypothetical protein [Thermoproteota archaeon]